MKQNIELLLLIIILIITTGCKEEKTTTPVTYDKNTTTLINIHGKTDKRLKLQFYVSYRPKYFKDGKVSDTCTQALLHPLTATKRGEVLHSGGAVIENQDEYNITFPIFNKILLDKCTSTPVGISVHITRLHEKHGLYADVPIYTDMPIGAKAGSHGGSTTGSHGFKVAYRVEALQKTGDVAEPPKYFRVRDRAVVRCLTKHYEKDGSSKEHVSFRCELPYKGNAEWRDTIKDDSIRLDIIVDDNKSFYYPTLKKMKSGIKGHSEPFQEEKLNWYDKLKLWISGE